MCLITYDRPIPKRTEKEETYYKVLFYFGGDAYRTPYRGQTIYLDKMQFELGEVFSTRVVLSGYEITEGGFHLFKQKEDAEKEAELLNHYHPASRGYRVVKAVVPKGTPYVEGFYGGTKAIIVKKVTYKRI